MASKPLVSASLNDSGAGRGIRAPRVAVHGLGDGLAAIGNASRDEVKQRGTEIVKITSNVQVALPPRLLWAHVLRRAHRHPCLRHRPRFVSERSSQTQVDQLRHALRREDDVCGLDIAVGEPMLVQEAKCCRNVQCDPQRCFFVAGLPHLEELVEGQSPDVFHDQVGPAGSHPGVDCGDDVRVVDV